MILKFVALEATIYFESLDLSLFGQVRIKFVTLTIQLELIILTRLGVSHLPERNFRQRFYKTLNPHPPILFKNFSNGLRATLRMI